ncbi:MAG: branched-chain amino acid ABC transporter permease [Synergistaceae bacterium]|jgi:branched-chain amino acid transport system permease protein|nr:branched-chain amino acid ABC transporter permease [Synergistaceae bacterium]
MNGRNGRNETNDSPLANPKPALWKWKNPYLGFVLFGLLLSTLPLFSSSGLMKSSTLNYIGNVLVYAVAALGLNLLLGYAGLISLGTAGFMGLGSYIAAYIAKDMGMSFWAALTAAVLIPTLVGLLIGLISLRIEGIYLAIATLCVSEILLKSFEQADSITGGMQGKSVSYPVLFGHALNRSSTYVLLVVVLTLVMMLTHSLVNGQKGRALHAMRGSEVAAQAMGVNLLQYRLIAFSLATAYSALSGVLYVFFIKFSYPSVWNLNLSLYVLAAVVIGGLRSIYGTIVGTLVVWAVPDLILKNLPIVGKINGLPYIFNGILIIVVVMFAPQGISGLWQRALPFKGKKKEKEAE